MYEPISKSWATKFLTSQLDSLVLAARPSNSFSSRFVVKDASIHNRSGSSAVVGVGGRFPVDLWKAGQWVDATTTFTDDTTDAQDAGTNDFALTTTTNNDGFIVLCKVPFNLIDIVVGTAAAGGTPAFDLAYSIAGGTWSTISNAYVHGDLSGTGENLIWFEPPTDWAVSEAGHATGIDTGYYAVRVRATTAPNATAALATLITLGRMLFTTEGVADNAVYSLLGGEEVYLPPQCDALMAAISVANSQNRFTGLYKMVG